MAVSFRVAVDSARSAYRSFSWSNYSPLFAVLVVQALYLVLGLDLGWSVAMATVGTISRLIAGESSVAYPAFLELLPLTFSYVEAVTFVLLGAVALPWVVARTVGRLDTAKGGAALDPDATRRAILPTFLALAAGFVLTWLAQQAVVSYVRPGIAIVVRGAAQNLILAWAAGMLATYAISALFAYVPIVAVLERRRPMEALTVGIAEGRKRFLPTYLFLLLFSLPATFVQLALQAGGVLVAARTRPENIAVLLLVYAVLGSLATYFVWTMATRFYRAKEVVRG
jgi:hypothetical protein